MKEVTSWIYALIEGTISVTWGQYIMIERPVWINWA